MQNHSCCAWAERYLSVGYHLVSTLTETCTTRSVLTPSPIAPLTTTPSPSRSRPRHRYEQEASPEEFFTPYIWQVVCDGSGIDWSPDGIALFAIDSEVADQPSAEAPSGTSTNYAPPLTVVDVEESARE